MSSTVSHVSRVRALYKALLKLHRGLPLQMQALGNEYVKSEFRAHKIAKPEEVEIFMHEWTKYYVNLAKQLAKRKKDQDFGEALSPELLENFQEDQLGQLYELFKATTMPESKVSSNTSKSDESR